MRVRALLVFTAVQIWHTAVADEPVSIPMHSKGSQTFYIHTQLPGSESSPMLVDTGSGYSVINEETLNRLQADGQAVFLSKLRGKMADGSERIFPLYRISEIKLGNHCVIRNFKAAVMPGDARQIIGMSTLKQAGSIAISFDPPSLTLSHCSRGIKIPIGELASDQHHDVLKNDQVSSTGADET